ncbi:MAG: hypothetical protein WA733_20390 [Methylocystis sp.]
MTSELTAHEIVELLKLEPNATCGFVRVTYVAKQTLAAGALPPPFERGGPLGSGLYFLVTPDAAAGFWAPAPNGPALFRRMWKSVISTNGRRNIRPSPRTCARSRRP